MGIFLGSMHVPGNSDSVRKLAIKALRKMYADNGYEETYDPKLVQIQLTFVVDDDLRWTSVYCKEWESDHSMLVQASSQLSKDAKAPVLSVAIHDSDAIVLGLYERGNRIDCFATDPDFFGLAGDCRGNVATWQILIADGETPEQLSAVWDAPFTFVEEMLPALAAIFRIPAQQLQANADELSKFNSNKTVTLNFYRPTATSAARIALEKSELLLQDATYQLWLKSGGQPPKGPVPIVGDQLSEGVYFINRGLPFKGFLLTIEGSALTEGVVSFNWAVAKYHATSTKSAKKIGYEQHRPQVEQGTGIDSARLLCRFDEAVLTSANDPADRFRISIVLVFQAQKAGIGAIRVRVIPAADESAALDYQYSVEVAAQNSRNI